MVDMMTTLPAKLRATEIRSKRELLDAAADEIESLTMLCNMMREEAMALADERKWISVNERLPETIPCSAGTAYSEAIIVLTSGRKVVEAIFDGTQFIGSFDYWECEDDERVTHWMPLPEPPEVSE